MFKIPSYSGMMKGLMNWTSEINVDGYRERNDKTDTTHYQEGVASNRGKLRKVVEQKAIHKNEAEACG